MGVAQYTTPTFSLTFDEQELDLTTARNVYVTFASGGNVFTKTGTSLDVQAKQIDVFLEQAETGLFDGYVSIQANWTSNGGTRTASEVVTMQIDPQLLKAVVE